MPEPPDLQAMASRYLDLWQQQLGGVAEDDQAAEIMARTLELMNAGAATFAAMAAAAPGPAPPNRDRGQPDADPHPPRGRAGGAPSAAAPLGPSDHDLAEFARRLERLEERVASLEAGARKRR